MTDLSHANWRSTSALDMSIACQNLLSSTICFEQMLGIYLVDIGTPIYKLINLLLILDVVNEGLFI